MKKLKLISTIIFASLLAIGCEKDDEIKASESEYLIFGHFYGYCQGEECIEIYKLENDRLSEDTNDNYPTSTHYYDGNYIELSDSKFNLVKDLPDFIPAELLNNSEKIIGAPDAADGGGIYIEYYREGIKQSWLIDNTKTNVPEYLHNFIDEVHQRISLING